jgi:hypothetical protein
LLASRSSAVPPVCSASAEFRAIPDDGLAEPLLELALDDDPLDVLDEPEVAEAALGGGGGAVGVNVELLLLKPSADA